MAADAHIHPLHTSPLVIRRALLSVSDKTGLIPLAEFLHQQGIELVSTGGTKKTLQSASIPVKDVADITGFPEVMDGRVKTLHPSVHAGLLARTSYAPDVETLAQLDIRPFELVVVNLYPFGETVAKPDTTPEKALEFIDIGGPTMVRASAKNFPHVCILTNPDQYDAFMAELASGAISFLTRRSLAAKAFEHTSAYDTAITQYFSTWMEESMPSQFGMALPLVEEVRYGENPQQKAGVYGNPGKYVTCFHGKQLSYNNYLDLAAAIDIAADFKYSDPTCVIIKHTNPSGVATAASLAEAYALAFATDTISPFGGIIAVNTELDVEAAAAMDAIFTEIIIAPSFSPEAEALLKKKSQRRLIRLNEWPEASASLLVRSILGGVLVQQQDAVTITEADLKVVTKRQPSEQEIQDLLFAWKIAKHAKSNCIVFAKEGRTLGIGVGQTSRVDSSELAVLKAAKFGLSLQGAAVASEAFFPFSDGVEAAAAAGCTSVIQPGGSVRDEDVIATADRLGLAMVFTGIRHFKH